VERSDFEGRELSCGKNRMKKVLVTGVAWEAKVTFKDLAKKMVDSDIKLAEDENILKQYGKGYK